MDKEFSVERKTTTTVSAVDEIDGYTFEVIEDSLGIYIRQGGEEFMHSFSNAREFAKYARFVAAAALQFQEG